MLKKVYQQLLTVQKLEKLTKKALHSGTISPNWVSLYGKASGFSAQFAITLPPITSQMLSLSTIQSIIPQIKILISSLTVSAKSKEEEHKAQAIKKALEQRCNNFRDNQTKMYDSLLNRER